MNLDNVKNVSQDVINVLLEVHVILAKSVLFGWQMLIPLFLPMVGVLVYVQVV